MANRYRDHDGGRRMRHIDVRSNYLVHVVNVRPGLDWRRLRSTIEDTCGKVQVMAEARLVSKIHSDPLH